MPDIVGGPVIKRRSAPHVFKLFTDPAFVFVIILLIKESAVSLKGFVCSHAQKTYGFFRSVSYPVPSSELFCQILLVHFIAVGPDRIVLQIDHIFMFGHFSDPELLFFVVPGIPEHFIAAQRRPGGHRKADPVRFYLILDLFKSLFNILCSHCILGFKVLVKDPDGLFRIIFVSVVQDQI